MDNLCNGVTKNEKIKVISAEIVVHGTVDKPYFELEYYTMDGQCHIGYSSYNLENVFKWRKECFEIMTENQKDKQNITGKENI